MILILFLVTHCFSICVTVTKFGGRIEGKEDYNCYIIKNIIASNFRAMDKSGGIIYLVASSGIMTMTNSLIRYCQASKNAICLIQNAKTVSFTNVCTFQCKSDENSFGEVSGHCTIKSTSMILFAGLKNNNNMLLINVDELAFQTNNISKNTATRELYISNSNKNTFDHVTFDNNSIEIYGIDIFNPVDVFCCDFLRGAGEYVIGFRRDSTINESYFLSNTLDVCTIFDKYKVTISNCYTDKDELDVKGSVIIESVEYNPYPTNIVFFTTAECKMTKWPTPEISYPPDPTPFRTLPSQCAPNPDPNKKKTKKVKRVFSFASALLSQV